MSACHLPLRPSPCRHCHKNRAHHRRGLCRSCYAKPEIRALYPRLKNDQDKGGLPDRTGYRPAPANSTDALPGSAAKVAILAERAAHAEALWHRGDARADSGSHGFPVSPGLIRG
jgi:hypothetical protein